MKLVFSVRILEKNYSSGFMEIRPVGTDGHDEADSRLSQFFQSARKPTRSPSPRTYFLHV